MYITNSTIAPFSVTLRLLLSTSKAELTLRLLSGLSSTHTAVLHDSAIGSICSVGAMCISGSMADSTTMPNR